MAPWETMNKLKELCARLPAEDVAPDLSAMTELVGLLALVVETQHHDLQVLKATVARLEHHVRHRTTLP